MIQNQWSLSSADKFNSLQSKDTLSANPGFESSYHHRLQYFVQFEGMVNAQYHKEF